MALISMHDCGLDAKIKMNLGMYYYFIRLIFRVNNLLVIKLTSLTLVFDLLQRLFALRRIMKLLLKSLWRGN